MPVMDGMEFLEKVRESGSRPPFGFVTSEHTPEMRSKAKDAGATFLIAKPFDKTKIEQAFMGARLPA
ncbi:MAG: response regulator [Proteobacteria bacterium]|nr:response regulator [Pseudomonadota bacterium]MCP4917161.1 response regulator [Pseudomonadota bacterium]